ncbi:succinate dehydrogenase/fumarate reductase iron-sulfur subunit [Salinarchaeum sp. IM2453]|uniref:succinate dehydrogenase/fumarate reductase iron-sulfur subunit n=1 Tax=Salinarchaeum sp. IM2453 TaxID=2862870 RepID=UPI001C82B7C0|nr:succinate dehydrogenase/fumarate reductase iron-sulfur subunit [Salinarchaeum sp. IM2453]QZA88902.1 succinate dehydrogenase/fumarate reductase iron-sulfur subunit [Salinarchaeum sp. IM2453]
MSKATSTDEQTSAEQLTQADETVVVKIYRHNPEEEGDEPELVDYEVPFEQGMTVLDALIYVRDNIDSTLAFRHSCRQAVCGSDALFINGKQRLGCKTQIADLEKPVRIEPLPHQGVRKDLVVDMQDFYNRMDEVSPEGQEVDVIEEDWEDGVSERLQSAENREKIKLSTRCIWCGACVSSCNIAAGDKRYLGPAPINKTYRFVMDEREDDELNDKRMEIVEDSHGVWRCQTQFSCTEVCPKDIPLTEHIQALKRKAVKRKLKFW